MSCPPILSVPEIETEAEVEFDSAGFRTVNEKVKSVEMGRVPAVVRTRLPPACDQAPEAALPEPETITCARAKNGIFGTDVRYCRCAKFAGHDGLF